MKSKIKKIAIAISVFAISLISSTQVFALSNNLTMNKTTTYYNRYGSDRNNSSWYWTKYNFENRTAYCIEPGIKEGTIYNQGDWNNTGLSNSIRTRVYLLAYYGYDYPGHQTDFYRMATQAMIWEAVLGNTSVSFSTGRWNAGDQIDVSAERNQIESLIANHYTRPSFNGQTINLNVGETTTLTDTNNVLEKFDISVSGAEYSVNGNTLTIKPTQVGDIQIRMIKKTYTSEAPVIFYGDGIQNMVVGGAIDPVVSSISIHSVGGKLNISKKDLDNRNNTPQGDAKLAGTVYGLYDETGKLIEKLTITEAESIQSNTLPSLGRFYIQEITPGGGYQLDDTKYYFNSTLDNINASLELFDKVINRNYDITKVYADAETKIMTPEPNVEFGFFNSKGVLYKKATTDSNGRLVINLVYGKYTVKQLTSTPNYEKVIYNIELLLKKEIQVILRINYYPNEIDKVKKVINTLATKFKNYSNEKLLVFDPAPIFDSNSTIYSNCKNIYNMFEPAKYLIEKKLLNETDALNLKCKSGQCYACHQGSFVVSPNGNLYKCTVTINDENAIVGNIFEGVDRNKYYFKWVNPNLPEKCNNCVFLPLCQGGCRAGELGYLSVFCKRNLSEIKKIINYKIEKMQEKDIKLLPLKECINKELYDMYQDIPLNEIGSTNIFKELSYSMFLNEIKKRINDTTTKRYILYINTIPIGELGIRLISKDSQIYYKIRASYRNKGYGNIILDLGLKEAKKLNFKQIRINCDNNNIPSKKIILKHNGIPDIVDYKTKDGMSTSYLINL